MGGILLLLVLCVVMALASFLAGALPLSMSLSQSQLRLISSIGVGILVGTSLIVIIPEGIEAVATGTEATHAHGPRGIHHSGRSIVFPDNVGSRAMAHVITGSATYAIESRNGLAEELARIPKLARDDKNPSTGLGDDPGKASGPAKKEEHHVEMPTFYIGLSLVLGFILMFLIDRLPRHAAESIQSAPQPRQISLENLGGSSMTDEEEADGFLGSLTPSPKYTRSLATTTGLVIHAAADGIAMGASATTEDMKLGLIIFIAIMIHKAPAAFSLTSILLKQGLSKRAARGHLIVFSLAAPVGALSTWMLITTLGGSQMNGEGSQWWTGMLLLFSAGTFLYVAMHAMQEDPVTHDHHSGMNGFGDGSQSLQRKPRGPEMRDTMATVGGMLLPLLTQFGHHH